MSDIFVLLVLCQNQQLYCVLCYDGKRTVVIPKVWIEVELWKTKYNTYRETDREETASRSKNISLKIVKCNL